nr:hypothetical protein [Tanacetum cinerariifolium]
ALPSPDYVPGPEETEQAPPSPVYIPYVPERVYPEYIPPEDDDSEEDDDEDSEEDPADYPADHDDEEEEHPALADSIPPPPALCVTAKISFRPQSPTLSFTKEDAERFLAMPIPPSSPLTLLSSSLPQIPSPPLPASPSIPYHYLLHHHPYNYYLLIDQRIDAQDTLIATLTTQLSSLQGHLATALGEIRALQAREQARAGAPEGASSST